MGSSKDILIDRIFELEEQVKDLKEISEFYIQKSQNQAVEKEHIYVHEAQTIWADSGELHLECEQGSIVFNMQTLLNDLPSIFDLCLEEHDKNRQYIINQIKTIK
tara:strand:+ start:379 stop:693 length:315 start_codon:yes stop_codon:yes gene_type:complete